MACVSCAVARSSASGELRDAKSLLDDLAQAHDIPTELALLPAIAKAYTDDELTDQARYLMALSLLRPHLVWHAPFPPPEQHDLIKVLNQDRMDRSDEAHPWRWEAAHGGEPWMLQDIPAEVKNSVRTDAKRSGIAQTVEYFWLLNDPGHPDVVRAMRLLEGIAGKGNWGQRAAHWLHDLRCNNTVVTFDILGSYDKGVDAPLVIDTRATNSVHFKLYRVRDPQVLLAVAQRIGEDFIYRDYGLGMQQARALRGLFQDISKSNASSVHGRAGHSRFSRRRSGAAVGPAHRSLADRGWG